LKDNHTIELKYRDGNTVTKTAKNIIVAVGGRPNMNAFPGCKE